MACPAGSYKEAAGPGNCTECPAGKFSHGGAATCTWCRTSCQSGYILNGTCPAGSTHDTPCEACPANTYRDVGDECISCDENARSDPGSPAVRSCKCIAGYTIVDTFTAGVTTRRCELCGENSFSGFGQDFCWTCDDNAQAPKGSTSVFDCTCNAGYSGEAGSNRCEACEEGTYKPNAGLQACELCYDSNAGLKLASSPRGSTSELNCSCPVGFYMKASRVCADVNECSADHGPCQSGGVAQCQNTFGSFICLCAKGYEGDPNAGQACSPCRESTFKDSVGKSLCTPCPASSSSVAASVSREDCVCNTGFYGPRGGPCAA